jgi:hypothetical protein
VLRSRRVAFEREDSVLNERRRGRELGEKVSLLNGCRRFNRPLLPLSPLRIGSSAVACTLAGSTYLPTALRGKENSTCCHASATEIESNTDSPGCKKRCSRLSSVETAKTVMMHGEGSGSRI